MSTNHHPASPAPAGLVAFAAGCFCFGAIHAGLLEGNPLPMLAPWVLGGFLIQFIVALRELDEGNLLGGNVFMFFACFFMLANTLGCILKTFLPFLGITYNTTIEGFGWLACTIALITWTPCYYKTANGCMGIIVTCADIALVIITLKDLALISGPTPGIIAGTALFAGGAVALYVAAAIQLNAAFEKEVLKLPPPIIK